MAIPGPSLFWRILVFAFPLNLVLLLALNGSGSGLPPTLLAAFLNSVIGTLIYLRTADIETPHRSVADVQLRDNPAASGRIPVIDGFRWLIFSLVFMEHFPAIFKSFLVVSPGVQNVLMSLPRTLIGSLSFIVLSTTFTYRYFGSRTLREWAPFLKRRLLRLLPPYWLVLAWYVIAVHFLDIPGKLPGDSPSAILTVLANALLVMPVIGKPNLIVVSWSLTYIVFGYFAVPLVARAFPRQSARRGFRLMKLVAFCALYGILSRPTALGFLFGAAMFMGPLLHELWQLRGFRWVLDQLGETGVFAVWVAALIFRLLPGERSGLAAEFQGLLYLAGLALFVAYRFHEGGWLNRLLANPKLALLGRAGFCFYLTHPIGLRLAHYIVQAVAPPGAPSIPLLLVALAVSYALSMGLAVVMHLGLEVPLSNLLVGVGRYSVKPSVSTSTSAATGGGRASTFDEIVAARLSSRWAESPRTLHLFRRNHPPAS
jgi:peptidoglycan/LPS O-acetylase OafA/YrhL